MDLIMGRFADAEIGERVLCDRRGAVEAVIGDVGAAEGLAQRVVGGLRELGELVDLGPAPEVSEMRARLDALESPVRSLPLRDAEGSLLSAARAGEVRWRSGAADRYRDRVGRRAHV